MANTVNTRPDLLNREAVNGINKIADILKKDATVQATHTELLTDLKHYAEQDRVLQAAQVYEERQIQKDEDKVVDSLDTINGTMKQLLEAITKSVSGGANAFAGAIGNPNLFNTKKPETDASSVEIKPNESDIIEQRKREAQEKRNRPMSTKTLDFLDKTGIVKRGSQGFFSRMYGLPQLARTEEKEKYIKREQELGSDKTVERLEKDFEELQTALKKKDVAEKEIQKTKEELNLSDKQVAETSTGKKLLEDIEKLTDVIKELDSAYKEKEVEKPKQDKSVLKEKGVADILHEVETITGNNVEVKPEEITSKRLKWTTPVADTVHEKEMIADNNVEKSITDNNIEKSVSNTVHEKEVETAKEVEKQTELLEKIEENTRATKDIPEKKEAQPEKETEKSSGILDTLTSTAGEAIASKGGKVLEAGKSALKMGGRLLAGAAAPLAVGAVGAYALHKGAEAFSESFGEGGFDVIHALHKQGIIDYNFGDSDILDWKAVQNLDNDTIQKMIDSDEFSDDDTKKLQDIIKGNNLTLPENTSGTDYILKPETQSATQVYNESANVKEAGNVQSTNNTVVAPTTVNNTSNTQQNVRLNVRDADSTIRSFVSSKYTR